MGALVQHLGEQGHVEVGRWWAQVHADLGRGLGGVDCLEQLCHIGDRALPPGLLGQVVQGAELDHVGLVGLEAGPLAHDGALAGVLGRALAPLVPQVQGVFEVVALDARVVQGHATGHPLVAGAVGVDGVQRGRDLVPRGVDARLGGDGALLVSIE